MGKPSRTIILSKHFDPGSYEYSQEDILRMNYTWLVTYGSEMIGVRRTPVKNPHQFKYVKLLYPERGRAVAMARQLNDEYQTDKFRVVRLDHLARYIKPEDCLDLNLEPPTRNSRRRGRPPGGINKPKDRSLITRRIVAVEERPEGNLSDLLESDK